MTTRRYGWDGEEWVRWGPFDLMSFTRDPCWRQFSLRRIYSTFDAPSVTIIAAWDALEFA